MSENMNEITTEEMTINGIYHVAKDAGIGHYSVPYIFKSEYFSCNTDFKYDLASMSLVLALSAFSYFPAGVKPGTGDYYKYQDDNVRYLLTGQASDPQYVKYDELKPLHFLQYTSCNYYHEPSQCDSMAVSFAFKPIQFSGDKTSLVLAVCVRGGGYQREWGGNFTMAPNNNNYHHGFDLSSDIVVGELTKYLNTNSRLLSGKDIKLWIVGYSRGAATANLAAGKIVDILNDEHSKNFIKPLIKTASNVFAYTFETPAGVQRTRTISPKDPRYNVIHNIINFNDFVTKVAPKDWEFTRFGTDEGLPSRVTTKFYDRYLKRMRQCMKKYMQIEHPKEFYVIDKFEEYLSGKNRPMSIFLDDLFRNIATEVFTLPEYHADFQPHIRSLVSFLCDERNSDAVKHLFTMETLEKLARELMKSPDPEKFVERVTKIVIESFKKYPPFETYTEACVKGIVFAVIKMLSKVIFTFGVNTLLTLIFNASCIVQGHFTAVCLAWLMSLDETNYPVAAESGEEQEPNIEEFFNDGTYRVIIIKAPTNVMVTDSNGVKVIEVIGAEITPHLNDIVIEDETYLGVTACSVNEGETILYLPPNETYTITMSATANGILSFTATERNFLEASETSATEEKNLSAGDEYVATINAKSLQGDGISFGLVKQN